MVSVQNYTRATLYPCERHGTHFTARRVGTRAHLDGRPKSRPSPGFDPWTVQPIASRYTDWAIWPTRSHTYFRQHTNSEHHSSQYEVYVRKHVTGTPKLSKTIFPYNHNKHIHFIWTVNIEVMWSETYLKDIPMHSRQMAIHLLKWNPKQKCLQRDQWLQFICTLWNSLGPQTVLQGTYMCTVETCI